jgi:predicted TIM-barrel fold metal-dependent hydrolase
VPIVDSQVHLNQLVEDWRTADPDSVIATAIAAMDAIGVDRVLIAESRGFDTNMRPALGPALPNGAIRAEYPFSRRAVEAQPSRFAYLMRVDLDDPELDRLVSEVRATPGALCLRIVPIPNIGEIDRLARGEFDPLFAAAEAHGVPVFAGVPGRGHLLEPYLRKFPKAQVILDHCGVGVELPRLGTIAPTLALSAVPRLEDRIAQLEQVIGLARYPNLSLKWCHAPARLSAQQYPHADVLPHLRRVIDAFGVERVMWASDYTQSRATFGGSWAEALYYLRDSDQLTDVEKQWLLGDTARSILRWD